ARGRAGVRAGRAGVRGALGRALGARACAGRAGVRGARGRARGAGVLVRASVRVHAGRRAGVRGRARGWRWR
ncbi:hypothetical protein CRG98_048811, partial [Punica granatum]